MDERTTGIILRTRPLTETSLIVRWLTPDLGRLATVAKGARRLKSPFSGKLDLFFQAEFSFRRSRRSDLHTLREVNALDFNPALRRELSRLQQASYFTKLIEQTTEIQTPIPTIYDLLVGALKALAERAPPSLMVYAFEMKLLHELGLQPDLATCALGPASKAILEQLRSADWPALSEVTVGSDESAEIGRFLHRHMVFHLNKVPAGRPAAALPESVA